MAGLVTCSSSGARLTERGERTGIYIQSRSAILFSHWLIILLLITFDQCSTAVKNTLFRAYCMPMYACQLWSKYTQTSMKRLRVAYNNAYRIIHYISRNVSVRPHQVSHCVRTSDAVLRNNLYRLFIRCSSSSNFFIRSLQISDAFYKSSFFLNYSTLLYGGQMQ